MAGNSRKKILKQSNRWICIEFEVKSRHLVRPADFILNHPQAHQTNAKSLKIADTSKNSVRQPAAQ